MSIGHNSLNGKELEAYAGRILNLEETKKSIAEDIKDIYAEAKSKGFDVKVLRTVLRRSKMSRAALEELDELVDTYEHALAELLS